MTLEMLQKLRLATLSAHKLYLTSDPRVVDQFHKALKEARWQYSDACEMYVNSLLRENGMLRPGE